MERSYDDKQEQFCAAYPGIHPTVREVFPNFDYRHPVPGSIVDFRNPKNCTGYQQRAFSCWWAIECCSPLDLGLDMGSPRGMTPMAIHVDVNGTGQPHPFYGGGPYLADVCRDAADTSIYSPGAFPYITSNHSLEHIPAAGDRGIIEVLKRWIGLLRSGGVLAMIVPDNAWFDVMASDKDHKHAWSAGDFKGRVLDSVLREAPVDLVDYDTLKNCFSFDVVLRKK